MSITQIRVQSPSNEIIFTDTAIGNSVDGIKSSSAVIYYVIVDNTANASPSYVKLFNVASGSVTVGTTAPDQILYCPNGVISTFPMFTGANPGITFPTALSAVCVTTGGTAGGSAPAFSVVLTVAYV